jgi:hypothetical protein
MIPGKELSEFFEQIHQKAAAALLCGQALMRVPTDCERESYDGAGVVAHLQNLYASYSSFSVFLPHFACQTL